MTADRSVVLPGRPDPLGATWDGTGVNFALFSAHAEKVELCLFDPRGRRELERLPLPEYTDQVWHGYLPNARPGQVYGYRVSGPYDPARGHRFNPHKLLLDPYARALVGKLRWSDTLFGYRIGRPRQDLGFDRRDSAPMMPKARVVEPAFTWGADRPPHRPWAETIVYELHVKGYTMTHPRVPKAMRGTFAGLASGPVLEHLAKLGVTAVELLPIQAFVDDRHLVENNLANFWGYNSIGYFAPDPRYLATGDVNEVRTMVRRLHECGIEVILDVVYNHTAEGNHFGPTLSFRGIDNASYYRLMPNNLRSYIDDTGCGNTLNLSHPRVLQLVLDSLRYWVREMHIDGFRFDLATVLAREPHGYDPGSGFLDAVRQDPELARVKLIAEPWDIGPGGYQLGNFPPGWAEWNDRFRDTVRRAWRGDPGTLPDLATRLAGSSDLFDHQGRRPWAAVNFVTCHDGVTLADLVSYQGKHNQANLEGNRDGPHDSLGCNHGVEGPSDDPAILELRRRQVRNLLATLLLAQGTPMLLAGDELGRTQCGNDNAYCQDNETSWLDWPAAADADRQALIAFVARLVAVRRAHPVLRRARFLHGRDQAPDGGPDIAWLTAAGTPMTAGDWQDPATRCVGLRLDGRAGDHRAEDGTSLADAVVLIWFNIGDVEVPVMLPRAAGDDGPWRPVLDTARPEGRPCGDPVAAGSAVALGARSIVLWVAGGRGDELGSGPAALPASLT